MKKTIITVTGKDTVGIIAKVCKANYFNACLIISVLEGSVIATQLLNVSNSESIIKLHLFDDDGEVLPEMYVYSRIGNNFLVGNESKMRNASKVHKVKLEDIDSNIKTFFSYVPIPEKEKTDKFDTFKYRLAQVFYNIGDFISGSKRIINTDKIKPVENARKSDENEEEKHDV